jgi:hypothetical protein
VVVVELDDVVELDVEDVVEIVVDTLEVVVVGTDDVVVLGSVVVVLVVSTLVVELPPPPIDVVDEDETDVVGGVCASLGATGATSGVAPPHVFT